MREHDESESLEDKCQRFRGIVTESMVTEPVEAERDWMAKECKDAEMEKARELGMRTGGADHVFFLKLKITQFVKTCIMKKRVVGNDGKHYSVCLISFVLLFFHFLKYPSVNMDE